MRNTKNLISGTVWVIILLLSFTNSWAQRGKTSEEVKKEIDQQVWQPFIKAYATQDGKLFNSIHDDNVLRASPGGILLGKEYKDRNLKSFARGKKMGISMIFEFKFINRQAKGNVAYEVVLYYGKLKTKNGTRKWFGEFHVVLKKINGRWQIVQDRDTNLISGKRIDEAYYQKTKGEVVK